MMKSVVLFLAVSSFSFLSGCGPTAQGGVHRSQMSETECVTECNYAMIKAYSKCDVDYANNDNKQSECRDIEDKKNTNCKAKCYGHI